MDATVAEMQCNLNLFECPMQSYNLGAYLHKIDTEKSNKGASKSVIKKQAHIKNDDKKKQSNIAKLKSKGKSSSPCAHILRLECFVKMMFCSIQLS
ncbi:hypothetical protein T4C_13262 [Trichinella pseudospiralis]|uniref:Uncharacterized protein n=1 Tax=Trichinella pseudospiralis TaxID=6337 RepID=A0A0V1JU56_TRIPS|nr:hypothetical protein T4C_13262 [Trichinella pseudospiralis]